MNLPTKVIAVDFETTGLNTMYDAPMALALAVIDEGTLTGEVLNILIRVPEKSKLSVEALMVQGLDIYADPSLIAKEIGRLFPAESIPQKDAMQRVAEWIDENNLRGTPCVTHRMSFDIGFYDNALARNTTVYKGSPLGPVWICTKQLANMVWPDAGRGACSLDACAVALGIPGRAQKGHDALEDAKLCALVYDGLRQELAKVAVTA